MPDHLVPGVFVEETSFRSKSIAGVSTSTTAFVGPTRTGPVGEVPELLTSFADFKRVYGGLGPLGFSTDPNYLAHAVMAYFNEGGARLYVARVAGKSATAGGRNLVSGKRSRFVARFPGASGNGTIVVALQAAATSIAAAAHALDGSLLRINAKPAILLVKRNGSWRTAADAAHEFNAQNETDGMTLLTARVTMTDADRNTTEFDGLGLDPLHPRYIGKILIPRPATRADQLTLPFAFDVANTVTAFELHTALAPSPNRPVKRLTLAGGTDVAPTLPNYTDAFALIEGIEDVSIVAAPGHTQIAAVASGVTLALVAHAERRRSYRIAVLDVPRARSVTEARAFKAQIDSKYAALYYPWVVAPNPDFNSTNPNAPAELTLPPSGFLCGIYARSDIERGVWKAPANEVVRSALRFERPVTTGEQEVLNPLGVNCLRTFAGRGHRVWGARTTSSDPEWKYVNVRRYFLYLEHSIDRGTQWAVFEPNGEALWAKVHDSVSSFLYKEWVSGALLGDKPEAAFFIKCDRSTMTQNDLDNGRLICLVGVAVIKPAKFIVFRIGQKTADARA